MKTLYEHANEGYRTFERIIANYRYDTTGLAPSPEINAYLRGEITTTTDEVVEDFLALVRSGETLFKAGRSVGMSPKQLKKRMKLDAAFAEDVQLAEDEAAEAIESRLRAQAMAGEPWAIKEWLTKRTKRWAEKAPEGSGTTVNVLNMVAGLPADEQIKAIEEMWEARAALNAAPIIDAEVIDDENN